MQCLQCNTNNPPHAKFCENCGTPLGKEIPTPIPHTKKRFLSAKRTISFLTIILLLSGLSWFFYDYSQIKKTLYVKLKQTQEEEETKEEIEKNGCGIAQDAEGNRYGSIIIGTQCWLDRNLNLGTMLASGTTEPTNNGTIEKWCYNNDPNLCATDGGLYNWDEAMQYVTTQGAQGICPTGWHIPTDAEQYTLENYLKDAGQTCIASRSIAYECDTAGTKLKVGGTSGFNGILSGNRITDGAFDYRTTNTDFWSSSGSGSSTAWSRNLYSGSVGVGRYPLSKAYGFSVRCLKD